MSLDITLYVDVDDNWVEIYSANITHNLSRMAGEVNLYDCLWGQEVSTAGELAPHLTEGVRLLKESPDYYREFEPHNKWGTYDNFVPWLEELLKWCEKFPSAKIHCSV